MVPNDQSERPHPGAAFGIPSGASGEEVVDAVFGDGVDRGGLERLHAQDREIGRAHV